MISVVVSSYRPEYLLQLEKNIKDTIGVQYELIRIDNDHRMSVTHAYNRGAHQAKYEYLCFLHEDVHLHTPDWGKKLADYFLEDSSTGVIGVAGATIKPHLPIGWFTFSSKYDRCHLIQRDRVGRQIHQNTFVNSSDPERKIQVKVLDGVFLFTSREVWKTHKFDETIPGYHFYDVDFSLKVSQTHTNYVTSDVLIEHYSLGDFGTNWLRAAITYYQSQNNIHLFDDTLDYSWIRNRWYYFLAKQKIDWREKFIYLHLMGIDWASWPYISMYLRSSRYRKTKINQKNTHPVISD